MPDLKNQHVEFEKKYSCQLDWHIEHKFKELKDYQRKYYELVEESAKGSFYYDKILDEMKIKIKKFSKEIESLKDHKEHFDIQSLFDRI